MTVSGRELPRTSFSSPGSHSPYSRFLRGSTSAAPPQRVLVFRQRPPPRCHEVGRWSSQPRYIRRALSRPRRGDGRALAVLGECSVAVVQAELGLPGARPDLRRNVRGSAWRPRGLTRPVLVVPGGLDQQPAGVAVAGLRYVPSMLLPAGEVLARCQPELAHQLPGEAKRRKSPISASNPSAVRVAIPRKEHSHLNGSTQGSVLATRSSCSSTVAICVSSAARWQSARCSPRAPPPAGRRSSAASRPRARACRSIAPQVVTSAGATELTSDMGWSSFVCGSGPGGLWLHRLLSKERTVRPRECGRRLAGDWSPLILGRLPRSRSSRARHRRLARRPRMLVWPRPPHREGAQAPRASAGQWIAVLGKLDGRHAPSQKPVPKCDGIQLGLAPSLSRSRSRSSAAGSPPPPGLLHRRGKGTVHPARSALR